jgi:hypothetical protein
MALGMERGEQCYRLGVKTNHPVIPQKTRRRCVIGGISDRQSPWIVKSQRDVRPSAWYRWGNAVVYGLALRWLEQRKHVACLDGSRSGYHGTRTTWVARMASLDGDSDSGEMGDQCLLVGIRAV